MKWRGKAFAFVYEKGEIKNNFVCSDTGMKSVYLIIISEATNPDLNGHVDMVILTAGDKEGVYSCCTRK